MLGFIFALVAGFVTPMAEDPVGRPLAKMLADTLGVEDSDLRVLTFMAMMLIAGILSAVFATGSALGLAAGGALGYFGMRILRWLQRIIEGRRD